MLAARRPTRHRARASGCSSDYRAELGDAVVEIEQADVRDAAAVAAAVDATVTALAAGAPVVYQATFADDGLHRLRRLHRAPARRPLPRARHQARPPCPRHRAAAARRVRRAARPLGMPCDRRRRTAARRRHDERAPPRRHHPRLPAAPRALEQIVDDRVAEAGPVAWGDPRYALDGRCPTCDLEVQAHRDVLLVAGLRVTQRDALLDAGITTIDELATSAGPVPDVLDATIEACASRPGCSSRPRLASSPPRPAGTPLTRRPAAAAAGRRARGRVARRDPRARPGRPLLRLRGRPALHRGRRHPVGSRLPLRHGRHRRAVHAVLGALLRRRAGGARQVPRVRRGCVARCTPTCTSTTTRATSARTSLSIAARHGVGEADVDQLLADGVLVDLYPIVKRAVRVGRRSYSIKKLEPLYMGDAELREAEVKSGGDSITRVRASARARRHRGPRSRHGPVGADAAQDVLDDLADYNRYDCVSTLRLRDWLLGLARREGGRRAGAESLLVEAAKADGKVYEPSTAGAAPSRPRRPARRPRPRRRPHRARPRRGRHRLPRPRGEELLVVALLPRRPAARGLGRPPRRARRRSRGLSAVAALVSRRPAPRRPARAPAAGPHRTRLAIRVGSRAVRALRAAGTVPAAVAAARFTRTELGARPRGTRRRPRRRRALDRRARPGSDCPWRSFPARRPTPVAQQRRDPRMGSRRSPRPTRRHGPTTPRSTCCGGSRPARSGRAARAAQPTSTTTSTPSSRRCGDSTTRTSPSRAHPAPARPMSPHTSSPSSSREHGWKHRRRGAVARRRRARARRRDRGRPRVGPIPARREGHRKTPASPAIHGSRPSSPKDDVASSPHERDATTGTSSAAPPGTSRNADRVRTPLARPARHRRGRAVLARVDDRRRRWPLATCCCSATLSSCRR